MSVFQNVLKTTMEGDQNDLIFKKFIMRELNEKKKLPAPFHIGIIFYYHFFLFEIQIVESLKKEFVIVHILKVTSCRKR